MIFCRCCCCFCVRVCCSLCYPQIVYTYLYVYIECDDHSIEFLFGVRPLIVRNAVDLIPSLPKFVRLRCKIFKYINVLSIAHLNGRAFTHIFGRLEATPFATSIKFISSDRFSIKLCSICTHSDKIHSERVK